MKKEKREQKSFIQLLCALLDEILITLGAFPNGNLEKRQRGSLINSWKKFRCPFYFYLYLS